LRNVGLNKHFTSLDIQNHIVMDNDDCMDLLLSGTEVRGSCQNFLHGTSYIEGLLGYMGNGANRIVTLKEYMPDVPNSLQPIKARAIVRILWDPNGQQPVLFMEPVFCNTPQHFWAILELCNKKAHEMQLPLAIKSRCGTGKNHWKLLQSLQGPAPWDMSDSTRNLIGTLHKDGIFNIECPEKVILPLEGAI